MLKMNKRGKDVNWSMLANASPKTKRLHLEKDDCDDRFHCPVQICKHDGFTTQRGCRKQVKSKHSWYYYFDQKPDSVQTESFDGQANNNAAADQMTVCKMRTVATFDKISNINTNFL